MVKTQKGLVRAIWLLVALELGIIAAVLGIHPPLAPKFVSGAEWYIDWSDWPAGYTHCFRLKFAGGGGDKTCVHLSDEEHRKVLDMMDAAEETGPFALVVSDPRVEYDFEGRGHFIYTRLLWIEPPKAQPNAG